MRTVFFLLLFFGTSNILKADNITSLKEAPSADKFRAEDPYKSTNYGDRPFQEDVDLEYFSVDDLLKANLPTFWNYMTSVSKGLEVGELAELKNELNINEKKLLDKLQEKIPEISELVEENENLEAEIQHFLVLRRAELKDLYKQIKRVKKELELQKITKVRDLDTVQGRIQVLYDDIDTHLEDPHSSYNDDYILNRKKRISRLMKKRRVLKTDLKHLNYSKVQRKQKQLEFLLDRKKEIHENSKSLQFKFTQKRVTAIQKNNARINYLISVSLPKRTIKKIRRSMKIIRKIRDKIAKMERSGSKAESNLSSEEQSIRFEKEYYSQIERREDELMDEIRRDREKIKGFRSRSRVDQKMKPATALNSTSGLNGSSTLSNSESDVSSEKNEYVYVYKTNQSPSAAKGINPNNGGAMWVFPVKKGTNILQNMERIGIPSGVTMQMGQNNQPQNAQILQQLEQLRMQNQLLQQQLYRSENMGRQQYYQPPVQNYQQPSQNYGAQVTPSNRNMSNESILPIQQRTEQNVVPVQQRKTTPPPRGGSQSMSQKRTYNNTQLLNGRTRQGAAQVEPRQYRSTVKVREEVPVKSPELNNVTLVPKKKDALSDFTLSDDLLLK